MKVEPMFNLLISLFLAEYAIVIKAIELAYLVCVISEMSFKSNKVMLDVFHALR
jgi:hypothetical protein